jgi:hypothetical protein
MADDGEGMGRGLAADAAASHGDAACVVLHAPSHPGCALCSHTSGADDGGIHAEVMAVGQHGPVRADRRAGGGVPVYKIHGAMRPLPPPWPQSAVVLSPCQGTSPCLCCSPHAVC